MKLIKKCILALTVIGLFTFTYMPATSFAYEVEIHHDGTFWVETNSIRKNNGRYSVDVHYGKYRSRFFTYKFYQKSGTWYCINPGTFDEWVKVEPNSSDNDILYVVLNNS